MELVTSSEFLHVMARCRPRYWAPVTGQNPIFYTGDAASSSFRLIYCVLYDRLKRYITAVYLQVLWFFTCLQWLHGFGHREVSLHQIRWGFSSSAQGVCKWGCGKIFVYMRLDPTIFKSKKEFINNTPNQTGA